MNNKDRYFFNIGLNICAEFEWVVDYLVCNEGDTRNEAEENLLTKREYEGWYECEVSDTIFDAMKYKE